MREKMTVRENVSIELKESMKKNSKYLGDMSI